MQVQLFSPSASSNLGVVEQRGHFPVLQNRHGLVHDVVHVRPGNLAFLVSESPFSPSADSRSMKYTDTATEIG